MAVSHVRFLLCQSDERFFQRWFGDRYRKLWWYFHFSIEQVKPCPFWSFMLKKTLEMTNESHFDTILALASSWSNDTMVCKNLKNLKSTKCPGVSRNGPAQRNSSGPVPYANSPKMCWRYLSVSKNNGTPQIIHFNRVFHYFHHPFWVPLFLETPIWRWLKIFFKKKSQGNHHLPASNIWNLPFI